MHNPSYPAELSAPEPSRHPGRKRGFASRAATALGLAARLPFAVGFVATRRAPSTIRSYVRNWVWALAVIWLVVGGYLLFGRVTYTSKWTLILPTASSGISMQVESIGHAQTIPSSPFGSSSLSPKVIYKEIVGSEQVRLAAARSLGLKLAEFGAARVKLIDETALMIMEIPGATPTQAQEKAWALLHAFHKQLDILRRDEIQRRADVVQDSLKAYQANLQTARNRILEHQQRAGVLSINQFNETATSLELLRRKIADVRADINRQSMEVDRMSAELGIEAPSAQALLRLSADPTFAKMANEFSDSQAAYEQDAGRMAHANPMLALSRKRAEIAKLNLQRLVVSAGVERPLDVSNALLVINGTHRSELVKSMVASQATIAGRQQELSTLESEFGRLSEEVARMSGAVARLEDLKKDHLVAEAVFTSAVARLDTNKTDIYASYPMVQTLAAPDLPDRRSTPNTLIAVLGGIAASLLALLALGMAWVRQIFSRRH